MGGVFHLPVFSDLDWPGVARWALDNDYQIIGATARGGLDYRRLVWPAKTLLCIGSEASGLMSVPPNALTARVTIPLAAGAESLNGAVAAGILIYAAL
jgi:TrmH family RNA methyltransferase